MALCETRGKNRCLILLTNSAKARLEHENDDECGHENVEDVLHKVAHIGVALEAALVRRARVAVLLALVEAVVGDALALRTAARLVLEALRTDAAAVHRADGGQRAADQQAAAAAEPAQDTAATAAHFIVGQRTPLTVVVRRRGGGRREGGRR